MEAADGAGMDKLETGIGLVALSSEGEEERWGMLSLLEYSRVSFRGVSVQYRSTEFRETDTPLFYLSHLQSGPPLTVLVAVTGGRCRPSPGPAWPVLDGSDRSQDTQRGPAGRGTGSCVR